MILPARSGALLRCLAALAVASAALSACGVWRPSTVPLARRTIESACSARPDTLIVFLPGSFARPDEFVANGFLRQTEQRGIAADIVLVDAHLGYYADKTIIDRLHDDIVAPALKQGYRHVWLVGISVGAFGALIYAEAHPGQIDGIVALAPYLGSRSSGNEIVRGGGLGDWKAPSGTLGNDEIDLRLWRFLQSTVRDRSSEHRPALILGFGLDDRFAFSQRLLANAMSTDRVHTVPGGHDWPTWANLWRQVLDAGPWPSNSPCALH